MRKALFIGIWTLLLVTLLPNTASAYVDPGVLAILYQLAYAFVFGTLLAWVLRPWNYLKGLFDRFRRKGTESGIIEDGESHK